MERRKRKTRKERERENGGGDREEEEEKKLDLKKPIPTHHRRVLELGARARLHPRGDDGALGPGVGGLHACFLGGSWRCWSEEKGEEF